MNQKGITLIALVITIIVLAILTGVSYRLVAGNKGVVKQASVAVDTSSEAQAKEEVTIAWNSAVVRYLSRPKKDEDRKFSEYVAAEGMVLLSGNIDSEDDDELCTVKYTDADNNTFLFDLDKEGNVETIGSSTAVIDRLSVAAYLSPEDFYGKTVNYSANGITDWKIFYSNGVNTFLIASNNIPNLKVPASAGLTAQADHQIYWNSIPSQVDTANRQDELFMAQGYKLNESGKVNARCNICNRDSYYRNVDFKLESYVSR